MGQGELNEDREYLDNALMYYSDAASWYLKTFKGNEKHVYLYFMVVSLTLRFQWTWDVNPYSFR